MNTNAEKTPDEEQEFLSAAEANLSAFKKINNAAMREDAIVARLTAMREAGVKPLTMAIEAKLELNALEGWLNGQRDKVVTKALSDWLTVIDDEIAALEGEFVMTPISARIVKAIEQARTPKGKDGHRGVALIYGASGAGKSETAKWMTRMDENVIHVQANGERRKYVSLLQAIAEDKVGYGGHPAVGEKMSDYIIRHFPPGSVLIFDHAQLISLSVMEQLLVFPDEHGIALAFIGNTQGYNTLINAKIAQITSRVAGAHIVVGIPTEEDIDPLLEAWGIAGRQERKFCIMIGSQDGGLRYLASTVREARLLAFATGAQTLDVRLLKLGAVNAGCWGGAE